jgi:AraC-like DNA-binding protein
VNERHTTGQALPGAFGLEDAPMLTTRLLTKSAMAVTEIRGQPNFGVTKALPYDDAYFISLHLLPSPDHDQFFNGRYVKPENFVAGITSIYDLRCNPIADHRDPFHFLSFYLPRKALDRLTSEAGAQRIGDLRYRPAHGIDDSVVRQLLMSLGPALAKPEEASALFVDHIALALSAHIAQVYGGMRVARYPLRGGLAPWQERRAKELLNANLEGAIPLDRLATECGLSVRHFARAFRQSTGVAPHRWLLKRRVELAHKLLGNPLLSLAEVAVRCGFSDQSHFTRVFTAMSGASPGAWRRMQR